MLVEFAGGLTGGGKAEALASALSALPGCTRETDAIGWYKDGSVLGTIFTEISSEEGYEVVQSLLDRFGAALSGVLSADQLDKLKLSFHVYPDDWETPDGDKPGLLELHQDQALEGGPRKGVLWIKRAVDIAGSLLALILGSPLLLLIALSIKLTSRGPVLYRQKRVGQYGRVFTFLKFRSMQASNDASIHQEYVKKFIKGSNNSSQSSKRDQPLNKMADDPRVTKVGRLLRRTSLDELPQFINVLRGEMSLVGPRPPIPYEVRHYQLWHKRRFLNVKPGITGLWQVTGRSRTSFDEMVRLDLKYSKTWSLWLDLKILLRTPFAVIKGDGAV